MIPASFDYQRATSVDEALAALAEHGDDAKLLAGGHSLLPLMKLRLAMPSVLVDIGRIPDLSYVQGDGGEIRIGALTRHHDLATSELAREQVPLLAAVAAQIGDPQVRHRGTVGGSVAHGDPASDLPAAMVAMRATLVARGPGGERSIAADDFFTGFLETALAPDEILTEIRVPAAPDAGWGFEKFNAGPRTGPSSAWPRCSPTARAVPGSPWSTWARSRCGPAASRRRCGRGRGRATPRPGPRTAPSRPTTSTPPPSSAATWPRS